jgi:hypothetical protein
MTTKFFLVSFLFISSAPLLLAQVTAATVSGTVADSSGGVLTGATVVILNEETGVSRTVPTDATGRYLAPALSLGQYKISASQEGFQTEVRSGISLTVGRQAIVNFQLQLGSVTQTVEVTGEAPLVETTRGSLGTLVESQAISELPLNGRDLAQLITLQPGVVHFDFERGDLGTGKALIVGGGRATTNVFYMDGTSIESFNQKTPVGASQNFLGSEGVREFRTETNAYSAQYGRSSGGVFNIVTKSGTNTLHGSAFAYHRNDNLDASRWEDNKFGQQKREFKRNQYGFSIGGPIVADRTFYFGTYEALRQRLGRNELSTTFSESIRQDPAIDARVKPYLALWPLPNGEIHADGRTGDYHFGFSEPTDEHHTQGRVDHRISDRNSLFGRFTFLDSANPKVGSFPNDQYTGEARSSFATLEETTIISPTLLNTVRLGFTRTLYRELDVSPPVDPALLFAPDPSGRIGTLGVTGVTSVGTSGISGTFGSKNIINSIQLGDDVVFNKGHNVYKFGFNWLFNQANGWNPGREGISYTFNSIDNFLYRATPSGFRGPIIAANKDPFRTFGQDIIGLYFQNDVQLTSRVNLNVGLRYEFITVQKERYGRVANFRPGDLTSILQARPEDIVTGNPLYQNPSFRNFAPRLGFAWDMTGNGKVALRGGFGLFFEQLDQVLNRTTSYRMAPFQIEMEGSQNIPFPNIYQLCSNDDPYRPRNALCGARPILNIVPFKMRTPYTMQYNLNVQRELFPNTVLTLGFAGSRGIRLLGIGNLNGYPAEDINGRLVFPANLTARPNPNFDGILYRHPFGNSWYNSAQLSVGHKYAYGLMWNGSYTFSKTIDITSGSQGGSDFSTGTFNESNYYHRHLDKGLSVFDARHVVSFNSIYDLPVGPGKMFGSNMTGPTNWVLGGWQVGGIVSLRSGFPGWVTNTNRFPVLGQANETPDLVPGFSNSPTEGTFEGCALFPVREDRPVGMPLGGPDLYFDPCAFAPPPARTLGNVGRNTLVLPGRAAVDFTLSKNFAVTETADLQFRFEGFNFFNRVNFDQPAKNMFDASLRPATNPARITATRGSARQLQFSLKFTF